MSLVWNDAIVDRLVEAARNGVADGTTLIYEEVLHLTLDTQKTGRVYRHKKLRGPHQASGPYEPFANETGNALLKTKTSEERSGLTGVISANYYYAMPLEFGHINKAGKRVAPRPVFRPAMKTQTKPVLDAIRSELIKVLK